MNDFDYIICDKWASRTNCTRRANYTEETEPDSFNRTIYHIKLDLPENNSYGFIINTNFTLKNQIIKKGDYFIFYFPFHNSFSAKHKIIFTPNSIPTKYPTNSEMELLGDEYIISLTFESQGNLDSRIWYYDVVERKQEMEKRDNKNILIGVLIGGFFSLIISLYVLKRSSSRTKRQIGDSEKNIISHIDSNIYKIDHSIQNKQKSDDSDIELKVKKFIGSKIVKEKKYHYPNCGSIKMIQPENKIEFGSSEEAKEKGYIPCRNCKPP